MKKLKVLHIYKCAYPTSIGGIETFIHNLCKKGSSFNIENTVLAFNKKKKSTKYIDNYKVIEVYENFSIFSTSFSFNAFFKFRELAKKADLIHYHFPYPFSDILHFSSFIKKPTVVTYHSDIIRQKNLLILYKFLMYRFLNSVDHIVTTSANYFSTSKVLQNLSSKVSIIPIGIDLNDYPKLNKDKLIFYKNNLPKNFFLFIGKFRYYKGLHIALDAVKNTNLKIVLAGIGNIKKELTRRIIEENISNVILLDEISEEEKVCLLNLCKGFIFPSHLRSEAFGISLLEAAAFGKPLISCEIGTGTSYVNKNSKTGIVIKPSCPIQLRKAMEFILKNEKTSQIMGREAKLRSKKYFDLENTVMEYRKIYESTINKKM